MWTFRTLKTFWKISVLKRDLGKSFELINQRTFLLLVYHSSPPLSAVPNEELFVLDTKQDIQLLSAKERRKLKANKPLKCLSALQSHTKVADPIKKR